MAFDWIRGRYPHFILPGKHLIVAGDGFALRKKSDGLYPQKDGHVMTMQGKQFSSYLSPKKSEASLRCQFPQTVTKRTSVENTCIWFQCMRMSRFKTMGVDYTSTPVWQDKQSRRAGSPGVLLSSHVESA